MGEQTHASDIRRYVIDHYVRPARERGKKVVEIPVRAVHDGMGLTNLHPVVCDALRATSFRREAKVQNVTSKGPAVSPTTVFVCEL